MFHLRFYIFITIIYITCDLVTDAVKGEDISSGAQYLQNAIRDIEVKNAERNIFMLVGNANTNNRRVVPRKKLSVMQRLKPYLIDTNRRFSGNNYETEPQNYQAEPSHTVYHHEEPPHQPSHPLFSSDPQETINHESHPQEINTHQSDHYNSQGNIPDPPTLTKGELAALYEAAVLKGNTVHLNAVNYHGTANGVEDALPVQAAIHEIREPHGHYSHPGHGNTDAYYYYYYPLKSFFDTLPHIANQLQPKQKYKSQVLQTSHTHMHNVKVEPIRAVMEVPPKHGKALEPLFMAISGLVGMAVMFMFSMVLLPRFSGAIKKKKGRQGRHIYTHPSLPDFNWTTLMNNFIQNVDNYKCPTCDNINRNTNLLNIIQKNSENSSRNETKSNINNQ